MSGHFRWGGWALCKVCLVICSTHHLFNLLAVLWAAKMLICLAMGECFENGEMEVITLSTRQIKYFAYPHANIRTITIEYLPVFQLPAWFLDTVLYSSRWSAMWHLWAPPYPTFGSNSTAGCRKRLSTSYRSCPHSGILTKIPQENLCHVGRSCQTLFRGYFSRSLCLIQEHSLHRGSGAPKSTTPAPQPPVWWKWPPMKCTLREPGLDSVIRLLFPSYPKFLTAFSHWVWLEPSLWGQWSSQAVHTHLSEGKFIPSGM